MVFFSVLVLRKEQLTALEASQRAVYVEELVEHCKAFAPRLCVVAGDQSVRQTVVNAIERALKSGWDEQHLVRFYLELIVTLGCEFDGDPIYSWAPQYFQPSMIEDSHTLACRLYKDFAEYHARVAGPNNEFALAALNRLVRTPESELFDNAQIEDSLLLTFNRIYPEKAAYAGDSLLRTLINRAAARAGAFDLAPQAGTRILGGLMFAFGSGVCSDPLYPWIASVLTDSRITSSAARADRLWAKTRTYAAHAARYLESSS